MSKEEESKRVRRIEGERTKTEKGRKIEREIKRKREKAERKIEGGGA